MINLCFSGTAEGSLRWRCNELGLSDTDSIYNVEFYLHAGDISNPFFVKGRKDFYNIQYLGGANDVSKHLNKLKGALRKDTSVTIWYSSNDTEEYLNFLCFTDYLKRGGYEIYACDCKEFSDSVAHIQFDDVVIPAAPIPAKLEEDEIESISAEWRRIASENAGLRMLKNGVIQSLPDDYFDEEIFKIVERGDIRVGEIYRELFDLLPYLYAFVLYRVHTLIETGEIVVIEEGLLQPELYGNTKYFPNSIIRRRNILSDE